MKFLVTATLIILNSTFAWATNWEQFAKPHHVNGETLKISRVNFDTRFFAQDFCKKISMELADIKTVVEAFNAQENPLTVAKFKADLGDQMFEGVWAWTSDPVVKANDAKVFIQRNENPKVDILELSEVNGLLISRGATPYKGLPAICRQISK
jgi:hypothetical protein